MFKKDFIVTFIIAFLLAWVINSIFFPPQQDNAEEVIVNTPIIVEPIKKDFGHGEAVKLNVSTGSGDLMTTLSGDCPNEPFDVFRNGQQITAETKYDCPQKEYNVSSEPTVVDYSPWNTILFAKEGDYSVKIPYEGESYTTSFRVKGEGFFGSIWNTLFNRPIYNLMIFLTTVLNNSLGWSIVLLTLIIKLILLIPTQRALESNKAMQQIQPKLQEIKEKYKGDQQRIGQETMALMKKHKVNPAGSCLPMLIQLPVLIALYYATQNVLNLAYTTHLYAPLQYINIESINHMFLGVLDLSVPNWTWLPIVVGLIQFVQMKMTFAKTQPAKKKKKESAKEKVIEQSDDNTIKVTEKGGKDTPSMPDMSMINKYMVYFLPLLIMFFVATLPAGVGVYWGISSLFAIGQQYVVNKEKPLPATA